MYFIEITCLPDEDVSTGFVLGKIMDVLHLCLVNLEKQLGVNPVGISFPGYRYGEDSAPQIGVKIRLFSRDAAHLESLGLASQLRRFDDYVHIRSVSRLERPNVRFAIFKRVQPKSSKERLIRRQMKRTGQPEDVVRAQYQDFSEQHTKLPYVNMQSHSSANPFRLFVQKQEAVQTDAEWQFSSYGLSSTVPVPDF